MFEESVNRIAGESQGFRWYGFVNVLSDLDDLLCHVDRTLSYFFAVLRCEDRKGAGGTADNARDKDLADIFKPTHGCHVSYGCGSRSWDRSTEEPKPSACALR